MRERTQRARRAGTRALLTAAGVTVGLTGCVLHTMHSDHTGQRGRPPSAPQVTIAPLTLTAAPTAAQIAAHLCPLLAMTEPLGAEAALACRARGPAPDPSSLAFATRVEASLHSNNMIPLRLESVLLVLSTYPDAGAGQTLGAVCLTLCDTDQRECRQTDEACHSAEQNVLDLSDIAPVDGFVTSVAVADAHRSELDLVRVPAHGDAQLGFDLSLSTETVLDAIRENDTAGIAAMRSGAGARFTIPWAVEGTVWVEGRGNDGWGMPLPRTTGEWAIAE